MKNTDETGRPLLLTNAHSCTARSRMPVRSGGDHMAHTDVVADRMGVFLKDPSMEAVRLCIRQTWAIQMNNSGSVKAAWKSCSLASIHSRQAVGPLGCPPGWHTHILIFTFDSHTCVMAAQPRILALPLVVSFSWTRLVDIFIGTRSNLCKVACSQRAGLEHVKSKQRENGNKLLF